MNPNDLSTYLGLIISVWAVVQIVCTLIKTFRKPELNQNERISRLEGKFEEIESTLKNRDREFMTFFDTDKQRIDQIFRANSAMLQALLALLGHAINGNNQDELQKAQERLNEYLFKKEVL